MRILLIAVASLALAGCVTEVGETRLRETMDELRRPPVSAESALHQAIAIDEISGGRRGEVDAFTTSLVTDDQMRDYLEAILSERGMLAEEEAPAYDLDARIIRVMHPLLAMNRVDVTSRIVYTLVDRESGEAAFTIQVEEMYSTSFQDAPIAAVRQGLAAGGSVAKNVATLADELEAAFPVPSDGGVAIPAAAEVEEATTD